MYSFSKYKDQYKSNLRLALPVVLTQLGQILTKKKSSFDFTSISWQSMPAFFKIALNVLYPFSEFVNSFMAQEIHAYIRKVLAEKFGAAAEETAILYGCLLYTSRCV